MSDPRYIWRVNHKPRFTILEMGEYMAAVDKPRETILRNLKYERLARSLLYRTLNEAIASYLLSPVRDGRILARCREYLEAERDAATNPQVRENLIYELRALEAFERSLNALEIGGLNFERPQPPSRSLIKGSKKRVTISVKPTVHIRVKRPRGVDLVGALIVDVAKGVPPRTSEAAARQANAMIHSAILLHQYVTDAYVGQPAKASPAHCILFHTYQRERINAPSSYKSLLNNIDAVCRNIERGWDDIEPPPNFDPTRASHRY